MTDRDLNKTDELPRTRQEGRPVEGSLPPDDPATLKAADTLADTGQADLEQPLDPREEGDEAEKRRRRILIGSQRDPAAYSRRRWHRDWEPVDDERSDEEAKKAGEPPRRGTAQAEAPPRQAAAPAQAQPTPAAEERPVDRPPAAAEPPAGQPSAEQPPAEDRPAGEPTPAEPAAESPSTVEPTSAQPAAIEPAPAEPGAAEEATEGPPTELPEPVVPPQKSSGPVPLPSRRQELTPDLEEEFQAALGDAPLDELLSGGESAGREVLEPDTKHTGRVVAVQRDDVFLEFGGREQGCLPLAQLEGPPAAGDEIEVVVGRFNAEDGLYEVRMPDAAVEVDDWADIEEGMIVEARVTGHNTGGLECQVNQLRGFIPVSQVALYRVEDLDQFVDQKFPCLVTEANPRRRNLVLSRRAVLEREREEAREQLWESLAPGQVHEGVVRKLMDFGAFVDLGGVDGLLHISQLAWGRVNHPSEVLSEGQTIRVKIEKIDRENRRIGLAYREMLENPWDTAVKKFPEGGVFEGTVTKLMEFGAFVEMEPGVEGLVHISELSHKRVWRPADVVKEGDRVEVLVLSVDPAAQRMSLSMKQLQQPEPDKRAKSESDEPGEPAPKKTRRQPAGPLKGGLGRGSGGEQFGLKW